MREVKYTNRFQRDYKRERSGRHSKKRDALLMEAVNLLAAERRCHAGISITHYPAIATSVRNSLIYRKPDDDSLELVRLGSHSELGL